MFGKKSEKQVCPLIGGKPCLGDQCTFFVHLRGKDPQSTNEIDEKACAISWLPILLIENAQFVRQTAAAVDDLKNQTVQRQDLFNHTLNSALQYRRDKKLLEE